MTNQAILTKAVQNSGTDARLLKNIWYKKDIGNTPRSSAHQPLSNKDHYCSDRATD